MNPTSDPFASLGLSVVQRLGNGRDGQVLMVTSARHREGKTFVSRRLARRFVTLLDGPVLLVDANAVPRKQRKPSDIPAEPDGLFGCLAEGRVMVGSIQPTSVPGLSYMPASVSGSGVSLLFHMNSLRRVLGDLRERFALTVLDAGTLDNSGCMAEQSDGLLMVVDSQRTRRDVVRGALESPHVDRNRILGVVLNRRPQYVPGWLYRAMF